jgi:hypothetical protein
MIFIRVRQQSTGQGFFKPGIAELGEKKREVFDRNLKHSIYLNWNAEVPERGKKVAKERHALVLGSSPRAQARAIAGGPDDSVRIKTPCYPFIFTLRPSFTFEPSAFQSITTVKAVSYIGV